MIVDKFFIDSVSKQIWPSIDLNDSLVMMAVTWQ